MRRGPLKRVLEKEQQKDIAGFPFFVVESSLFFGGGGNKFPTNIFCSLYCCIKGEEESKGVFFLFFFIFSLSEQMEERGRGF